jgi:uncharacterized protein YvpB
VRAQNPLNIYWRHLVALFKLSGVLILAFMTVMSALIWVRASGASAFAQEGSTVVVADNVAGRLASTDPAPVEEPLESVTFAGLSPDLSALSQTAQELATTVKAAVLRAAAGWHADGDGRYYYYEDGTKATGTLILDGVNFAFDEQGLWISTRLDAPYVSQLPDMPSGCEVAALTMMLNYAGIAVSKEELAARMPYAATPDEGFTGNLYADGTSGFGGIIWPAGLLGLAQSYQPSATDLTAAPWEMLQSSIDAGKPVCVWISTDGLDHTVLLTGYSTTTVWVNDPLVDKDVELDLTAFLSSWERNAYRALSY